MATPAGFGPLPTPDALARMLGLNMKIFAQARAVPTPYPVGDGTVIKLITTSRSSETSVGACRQPLRGGWYAAVEVGHRLSRYLAKCPVLFFSKERLLPSVSPRRQLMTVEVEVPLASMGEGRVRDAMVVVSDRDMDGMATFAFGAGLRDTEVRGLGLHGSPVVAAIVTETADVMVVDLSGTELSTQAARFFGASRVHSLHLALPTISAAGFTHGMTLWEHCLQRAFRLRLRQRARPRASPEASREATRQLSAATE